MTLKWMENYKNDRYDRQQFSFASSIYRDKRIDQSSDLSPRYGEAVFANIEAKNF